MLAALIRRLLPRPAPRASVADAMHAWQGGDSVTAESLCRELLAHAPADADAHALLALVTEQKGEFSVALRNADTALLLREEEPAFHLMRARLLKSLGRGSEAIAPLQRVLQLMPSGDPERPPTLVALAQELKATDGEAAERHLREALSLNPDLETALETLATLLHHDSRTEEARALQRHRLSFNHGAGPRLRHALTLPVIYDSREHIAAVRRELDQELDDIIEQRPSPVARPDMEIGMTAFHLAYHAQNNRALLQKLCKAVRAVYPSPEASFPDSPLPRPGHRRPRIGFVSTYFHSHSVGRTTYGLIRDLPPAFESWVFAIEPQPDAVAAGLAQAAGHYVKLPADLDAVRHAIAEAKLDALIYADIGMHPLTWFLSFWRLAPLQFTTWGHSETSGVDTLDYYISAAQVEIDQAQDHYSEKLIALPGYFMPRYARVEAGGSTADREALGLPVEAHLYVCPQNAFKLHPDFDAALQAILERDPRALIVMLEANAHWSVPLRRRWQRTLGAALQQRIRLLPKVPHAKFLQLMACADLLLDPFHFGGCNSSAEAMALGVPLVTLPGSFLHGRFSLGLYREMDLHDCVAQTAEGYADIALRLGTDGDFNRDVRRRIAERSMTLFDRPDAGQALGARLGELLA